MKVLIIEATRIDEMSDKLSKFLNEESVTKEIINLNNYSDNRGFHYAVIVYTEKTTHKQVL